MLGSVRGGLALGRGAVAGERIGPARRWVAALVAGLLGVGLLVVGSGSASAGGSGYAVIGWGNNREGQLRMPVGYSGAVASQPATSTR